MSINYWNHLGIDMDDLDIIPPVIPEGYEFISFDEVDVPIEYRDQWETLLKRKWNVKKGSHVLFITHSGEVIATSFFTFEAGIGEPWVGKCKREHRKKGLYKYLMLKSFILMKTRNVKTVIAITSKKFLWPFYDSLGFTRGVRVK